jgi:DNA polymerase-1
MLPLIPIILESQRLGIRVDRQEVRRAADVFNGNRSAAERIAAGYAGFPLNLGSPGANGQLGRFLSWELPTGGWVTHKSKKPFVLGSVDEDTIVELRGRILPFDPQEEMSSEVLERRIGEGGHPLLEARVLYARATQWLSHYIEPMLTSADGRVYAQFHPWAQNTGRWSTVDPPLAQLPFVLRGALLPDEGWVWYEGDWSQIELRLIAALTGDEPLLESFRLNLDVHTRHMCEFFGYPMPRDLTKQGIKEDKAWISSIGFVDEDPRRVFAKVAVFRLCYGGLPEGAPSIPGAKTLGLTDAQLVAASKRWISLHPAIKKYWKALERQALGTRSLRTFLGRKWNLLGHDRKRILRQMYDFPMQGAVADIMNLTLIRIWQKYTPGVRLAYTMHDSIKLQVRKGPRCEEMLAGIRELFEWEWDVNGTSMRFPAEYKERG